MRQSQAPALLGRVQRVSNPVSFWGSFDLDMVALLRLQRMKCSLSQHIEEVGPLELLTVCDWIKQIIVGLRHIQVLKLPCNLPSKHSNPCGGIP